MKQLFSLLSALFAAFFCITTYNSYAAEKNPDSYQVLVLGDLHYDGAHLRAKTFRRRPPEMKRNVNAWAARIPAMLKAAAAYGEKNCLFGIQCGDLTQGDEGRYDLAQKSFSEALVAINKDQKIPMYVVRGNHDVRGKGKAKASDAIKTYMSSFNDIKFPENDQTQTCYRIVGKDLFVFYDSEAHSLPALKKILAAVPKFRHLFLVTHLPVFPVTPNLWLCYRYQRNAAKQRELRALLIKHNAIILTAHSHVPCIHWWKFPEGSVTQIVSFSIVKKTKKIEVINRTGEEHFKMLDARIANMKKNKRNAAKAAAIIAHLKPLRGKVEKTVAFNLPVAGFNILRIQGKNVYVDIYDGNNPATPITTQQIR